MFCLMLLPKPVSNIHHCNVMHEVINLFTLWFSNPRCDSTYHIHGERLMLCFCRHRLMYFSFVSIEHVWQLKVPVLPNAINTIGRWFDCYFENVSHDITSVCNWLNCMQHEKNGVQIEKIFPNDFHYNRNTLNTYPQYRLFGSCYNENKRGWFILLHNTFLIVAYIGS